MSHAWRLALAAWGLLALLLTSGHVPAQPAAPTVAPVALEYRRVYVPVDQLAKMGTGYMILEREEFQQLLDTINAAPSGPGGASARTTSASYVARLDQGLLIGQAQIELQCNAAESATVRLEPCSLAIATPQWDDARRAPARLGSNAEGQLSVIVEPAEAGAALPRTSRLLFDWSLRGARDPAGALVFDLRTPACPAARLELDLPLGTTPLVTRGIVARMPAPAADEGAPADNKRQRWLVELGGDTRTTLSLVADELLRQTRRYVLSRQAVSYDLQPQGLQVDAAVDLDIFHEALQQLTFDVAGDIQITSVKLGEKELEWAISPSDESHQQSLAIEFEEPLQGVGRTLHIQGWASAKWGGQWSLPTLTCRDALWQEGMLTLAVSPLIELRDLQPQACQQTRLGPAPRGGETYQFQCYRADARLEIVAAEATPALQVREGLTLKWEEANLAARLITDVKASRGQCFEMQANVPAPWIIDAVETSPPELLQDWSFAPQPKSNQNLTLRFAQSVNAERGARVQIRAHRPVASQKATLRARQYQPLFWQDAAVDQRLVSVHADARQKLLLTGDAGLQRSDVTALSPLERSRLETTGSRVVFAEASAGPQFAMGLRPESPRYAAAAFTTAIVGPEHVTQTHRLVISPENTPVARVLVHFSPAQQSQLAWRKLDEQELLARQLDSAEQRQLALTDGETWELTLPHSYDAPFELSAQREVALPTNSPTTSVALASFPEAESQTGEVSVDSAGGAALVVEPKALKPLLPAEQATSESNRATFRYTPGQDQTLTVGLAAANEGRRALWAWKQNLICRAESSGTAVCTASYQIENHGAPNLHVQLPAEARPRFALVNDQRIALTASTTHELLLPLPMNTRYVNVALEYELPVELPTLYGRATLAWPTVEFPVLASQAQLWLPPEMALADAQAPNSLGWTAALGVRERLFGFLARPSELPPPSLFSRAAWELPFPAAPANSAAQARADRCWNALDQLLTTTHESSPAPTWGRWLQNYALLATDEAHGLLPLRVDAPRLAAVGIDAQTVLTGTDALAAGGEPPALRLHQAVADAGVAFVFHDDFVLLTSYNAPPASAAHRLDVSLHTGASPLISSAPLAQSSFITAAQWLAEPQPAHSPWPADSVTSSRELLAVGWQAYDVPTTGASTLPFVVYRPRDIQALAWGLFLVACAAALWWRQRRWKTLLFLTVLSGITALVLPAPLVPCATALFLAMLASAAVMLLLPPRRGAASFEPLARNASSVSSSTSGAPKSPAMTAVLLAALGLLVAGWSQAQSPAAPANATPRDSAYRVLFPVNEDQQPANKYVYLPKSFYEALYRDAAAAKAIPRGWMLYAATYRAQLQWESVGEQLEMGNIVTSYDLEVFQPKANVTIALGRENVHPVDDRVSLDGEPIDVKWLEGGEGFAFNVEQPGRYRLELELQPTTRTIASREEIDFRIPTIARSRLLLRYPAEALGIQTPRAVGQSTQAAPGELQLELGPTTRLAIQWPVNQANASVSSDVETAQLMWWRIRPGSVVLDVHWKFKSSGQPLREIRLVTDPRLRLLPLSPDAPVAEQAVRDGDVQAIQFILKEPYPQELSLQTSFTLSGASGIGDLILPRVDAVADRTTRRWLAITAAPPLQAAIPQAAPHKPLATNEFATAWGSAELPQQAIALSSGDSRLIVHVEPQAPQFTARQALTYAVTAGEMRAELEALVNVTSGTLFQHRVLLPAGFEPVEASITAEGASREVRITRAAKDALMLSLPAGTSASYRLIVKAKADWPARSPWKLSLLELQGAEPPLAVFIERGPSVRVKLLDLEGLEALPPQDDQPAPADGFRRVALLRPLNATTKARELSLDVRPNHTELEAQQLTSLTRNNGDWQLDLDVRCKVLSGEVERLRFDAPADIPASFRMNLPGRVEVVAIPGQSRPHLVVHLDEPQTGDFRLQLTAPLSTAPAERWQAPDIRILDAAHQESYVWLPARLDDQPIAWETPGLHAIDRPAELFADLPEDGQLFLAGGPRFQATIRRIERIAGVPQVRLADIHLHVAAAGQLVGAASFDLEPAGLANVTLEMPPSLEFIRALVDESPAIVQKRNTRRWQILLRHEQLPQRLEVLFTSGEGFVWSGNEPLPLAAPALAQLPVERTLWTISSSNPHRQLSLADPNQTIDDVRHATFALKNATTMLERAAGLMAESGGPEATAWLSNWARNARPALEFVARDQLGDEPSSTLSAESQTLHRELEAVEEQWGATGLAEQVFANRAPPRSFVAVQRQWEQNSPGTIRAMLPGSASAIEVETRLQRSGPWMARAVAVLALLLLAAGLLWLLQMQAMREFVERAPHVIGVGLGLAWWLLLEPAGFGLVIALLFAASAWRWRWPRTGDLLPSPATRRAISSRSRS
jgi:hypothetical protein